MVLIIILVSFTPMFLVGGIILQQFHASFREKIDDHLRELVLKHRQEIDSFLNEKLANIRFVAESFTYEELRDESTLKGKLSVLQEEYGTVFEDLGVVNAQGLQIAYAGPYKLHLAQYAGAAWFEKAKQSDYYISDVFLGLRGRPHFIVAVRKDGEGNPWILRATIDFVAFNTLVENLRIGKTGFAFILNKEGAFQTRLPANVIPNKDHYLYLLQDEQPAKIKVHTAKEPTGHGKEVMYVASFLKGGDWLLVYQQDSADALSALNRARRTAFTIFLLGGLGIVSTAYTLSKRMVKRIARADREKKALNQQIIETGKLAAVGELAAGIAHEINNPVAIMVEEAGWIGDLLEEETFQEGENLEEFKRSLQQIKAQGKRCKEITHKLLSFARKTDARIQDITINEVIEELASLSSQRAKYSNVTLKTDLQEELPTIQVSHTEIQQVLLNLINNALDAMEKKGGKIDITTRLDGTDLVIGIADNGPGIPPANLGRIFDPFFTTKPVGKGTGLGLSICYGIVNKWGGTIDVESVIDVGTQFRIRIPIQGGAEKSTASGGER